MASRALRNIDQFETVQWMVVRFIIDEGPRYKIGNVSVAGNTKYTSEELMADLKLKGGDYFNQARMSADVISIQDKYGGVGYVFTDVKADPRFLDQPGTLDLVYKIKEGDRYRVGKIDVVIKGEFPHTKITTVINRLSLHPGDIVDIREIRASERRLRASQLFEANPANGSVPKIVYSPPDKENDEEDNSTEIARKPKSPKFRSQSPDLPAGACNAPQENPAPQQQPQRDRDLTLVLEATAANPEAWKRLPVEAPCTSVGTVPIFVSTKMGLSPSPQITLDTNRLTQNFLQGPGVPPAQPVPPTQNCQQQNYQLPPPGAQNSPQAMPVQQQNQQGELIIRGQYTPDSGHSTPQVFPGPTWTGTRPAAVNPASSPDNAMAQTQYPATQPNPAYSYQGGSAASQPPYSQPQYAQQQYSQPPYNQQPNPQPGNGYVQPGYSQQAAPQQSYPQQSYPQQSYPQQSYPQQSYPQVGSPRRPGKFIRPNRKPLSRPTINTINHITTHIRRARPSLYRPARCTHPPHSSPPHARTMPPPARRRRTGWSRRSLRRARLSIR